ncbi:MAG: hypothetical protein KJZ59_01055 [Pararhodobacter sp.]|nr:hypothetical protein [Pararhodobacter sp.]
MPRYDDGPGLLGYLFRLVLILLLVFGIGFVAFAYFGDLSRAPEPRSVPVDLNGG